jgi:hypothetical protein
MIHCRNCINWVDESLDEIEADRGAHSHVFMGCRIYGYAKGKAELASCEHYVESANLYQICDTCKVTVPKLCISFRECINCTDTDLFCVDHCIGGDSRKYCSHFARLHSQGIQLIKESQVFDLFPILGMPEARKKKG